MYEGTRSAVMSDTEHYAESQIQGEVGSRYIYTYSEALHAFKLLTIMHIYNTFRICDYLRRQKTNTHEKRA